MRLHLDFTKSAADVLGLKTRGFEIQQPADLERTFAAVAQERPDALITFGDSLTYIHRERIAAFTARQRLPGAFEFKEFAHAGGLISSGPDLRAMCRRAATFVDKILRGAKPSELPVEQPTKFELVINLKAAKALGVVIPPSVLARADEVLE